MRPMYDATVTKEDGTPLRKYEVAEVTSSRAGVRFALTLILGNMFLLLKNILFPDEMQNFGAAPFDRGGRDGHGGEVKGDRMPPPGEEAPQEVAKGPEVEEPTDVPTFRFRSKGSSTSLELIEEEHTHSRIPGFTYSSGTPLIASNDNPIIFSVKPEASLSDLIGKSGTGGGGAASDRGDDNDNDDIEEEDPRTPPRTNRLPVVAAPIAFDFILASQSVVFALSDLLRNAHDPDGDALKVTNFVSSKGQTAETKPGVFVFTPDPQSLGPVTFSYLVSDGASAVRQTATVTVITPEGRTIIGTSGSDVLIGTDRDDIIEGRDGDDTIVALGGNDVVYGGDGYDRLMGGDGDDVIYGGLGNDVIFAGKGRDVVSGGPGDDVLLGEEGEDTLFGDEGDDTLSGGLDADFVDGGDGDDVLYGEAGRDVLFGGAGSDKIEGGAGQDEIDAGAGDDDVDAGDDDDVLIAAIGDGSDDYDGGEGTDTYDISATYADARIDLFQGLAESEQIQVDSLRNIENVVGGAGNDLIIAGTSTNQLFGGAGDDIFVFRTTASAGHGPGSRDRILDFEVGDKIDLNDISREFRDIAEAFEEDGIKKFVLIKETDIFKRPGELRFKYEGGDESSVAILEGNIDTDADAEFEIEIVLSGKRTFQDHDFTWNS